MSALLTADEAARLHVGVNVIVRPGEPCNPTAQFAGDCKGPEGCTGFVAPQDWVALTGPCQRMFCVNGRLPAIGDPSGTTIPCEDCRDGRRIVPLYTECDCKDATRHYDGHCSRLEGRGSIEVVPVVDLSLRGGGRSGIEVGDSEDNHESSCTLWMRGQWSPLSLDPLPVPGRDFGVVIDCVEVASRANKETP